MWDQVCLLYHPSNNLTTTEANYVGNKELISDTDRNKIDTFQIDKEAEREIISDDLDLKLFLFKNSHSNLIIIYDKLPVAALVYNPEQIDPAWIVYAFSELKNLGSKINKETLNHLRYSKLRYAAIKFPGKEDDTNDLFATTPTTNFTKKLFERNTKEFPDLADFREDMNSILNILESLFGFLDMDQNEKNVDILLNITNFARNLLQVIDFDDKELNLIGLNVVTTIVQGHIPPQAYPSFRKLCTELSNNCETSGMINAVWIVHALKNWYLGDELDLEEINWKTYEIPLELRLLPELVKSREDNLDAKLYYDELLNLNFSSLSDQIKYIGFKDLQEQIALLAYRLDDYVNASTFFSYARDLFEKHSQFIKSEQCFKLSMDADLKHYEELAIAANLFHYTGRESEALNLAWSAMSTSLQILSQLIKHKIPLADYLDTIINQFEKSKRALIAKDDDMTDVVKLKLDELLNFIFMLEEGTIEKNEALGMIEMHRDSIQYLMPSKPPTFMLMTNDGRLIDNYTVTEEEETDKTINHLIAGALTAIRSILQEATLSEGSVKEINAGDSILLMEATNNFVFVASATVVNDKLRRFITETATELNEIYGEVLTQWEGDSLSIEPISTYINEKIQKSLTS